MAHKHVGVLNRRERVKFVFDESAQPSTVDVSEEVHVDVVEAVLGYGPLDPLLDVLDRPDGRI